MISVHTSEHPHENPVTNPWAARTPPVISLSSHDIPPVPLKPPGAAWVVLKFEQLGFRNGPRDQTVGHNTFFLKPSMRQRDGNRRIHGMGCMVYLPTWMVDFYRKLVGKYTWILGVILVVYNRDPYGLWNNPHLGGVDSRSTAIFLFPFSGSMGPRYIYWLICPTSPGQKTRFIPYQGPFLKVGLSQGEVWILGGYSLEV